MCETLDAHSGYLFPLSPFQIWPFGGSARHEFHRDIKKKFQFSSLLITKF